MHILWNIFYGIYSTMTYFDCSIQINDFMRERSRQTEKTESQNHAWNEIKSSDLKILVTMDFHRTSEFQKRKELKMVRVTVRFDVRERRRGRTRRFDDQRFKESGRSRGPLFDVKVAEVLYRSSESTREILHPRWNQRGDGSGGREEEGEREEDGRGDTASVARSNTDREERRRRMRERKKGRGRKKQGFVGRSRDMVGDSSLATCRGFFSPCGENSLTVRCLSGVLRGTFPGIDYQP